jgi:hypothetical protein
MAGVRHQRSAHGNEVRGRGRAPNHTSSFAALDARSTEWRTERSGTTWSLQKTPDHCGAQRAQRKRGIEHDRQNTHFWGERIGFRHVSHAGSQRVHREPLRHRQACKDREAGQDSGQRGRRNSAVIKAARGPGAAPQPTPQPGTRSAVEHGVDAVAGDAPVRRELRRGRPRVGPSGRHAYSVPASAARAAAVYTPRAIPQRSSAAAALESARSPRRQEPAAPEAGLPRRRLATGVKLIVTYKLVKSLVEVAACVRDPSAYRRGRGRARACPCARVPPSHHQRLEHAPGELAVDAHDSSTSRADGRRTRLRWRAHLRRRLVLVAGLCLGRLVGRDRDRQSAPLRNSGARARRSDRAARSGDRQRPGRDVSGGPCAAGASSSWWGWDRARRRAGRERVQPQTVAGKMRRLSRPCALSVPNGPASFLAPYLSLGNTCPARVPQDRNDHATRHAGAGRWRIGGCDHRAASTPVPLAAPACPYGPAEATGRDGHGKDPRQHRGANGCPNGSQRLVDGIPASCDTHDGEGSGQPLADDTLLRLAQGDTGSDAWEVRTGRGGTVADHCSCGSAQTDEVC